MNWDNDEGPWGSSQNNKPKDSPKETKKPETENDPWKYSRPSGGPSSGPIQPPDFGEAFRQFKDKLGPLMPKGYVSGILAALFILVGLWLASGFYMVGADQVGVVMRFGAFNRTELPGLRYHLPAPIEEVLLPVVTAQNEIQVGFRKDSRHAEAVRSIPQESLMLTQDENIINVEFTVFWRVIDVSKFLFEIRSPEVTIKMAAESAMREAIGQNKLQFALTEGRSQIAEEARKRLQTLMDEYNAGIVVTQINLQKVSAPDDVKAAFQDVVNARLDMERFQNQAMAHVNKVIPDAKGQAAKMIQQAMAYRDQKIAVAKGDADRFKEVLAAYTLSRDVTAKRLYLETMETVLGNANKIIAEKGTGTVPLLSLQDMMKKKPSAGEGN